MNLLPEEEKVQIGKERIRRLFAVSLWMLALLAWVGVILLLPSYFFIEFQLHEFQRSFQAFQSSPEIPRMERDEKETKLLASRFSFLKSAFASNEQISSLLEIIFSLRPAGVSITDLSYAKGDNTIAIKGNAHTRSDLLEFSRLLEARPEFGKAYSPLSNFLKEQYLDFSLSVEVVRNQ